MKARLLLALVWLASFAASTRANDAPTGTVRVNTTSITTGQQVVVSVDATDANGNLHYINIDQTSPTNGFYGPGDSGTESPPNNGAYDLGGYFGSRTRDLTLTLNNPGTYVFRGAMNDDSGWYYTSNTVTVTVSPANQPPTGTVRVSATSISTGQQVIVSVDATDANGNLHYINIDQTSPTNGFYGPGDSGTESPPNNGAYDLGGYFGSRTRDLTLTLNTPGTYVFRGAMNDDSGWYYTSNTVTVTVNPANQPPTGTVRVSAASIYTGQQVVVSVDATDANGNLHYINIDQTSPTNGFYGPGDSGTETPPNNGAYDLGGYFGSRTRDLTLTLNTPGTYVFRGAMNDDSGWHYTNNTVSVTVGNAGQGAVGISPSSQLIALGQSLTFTASGGSGSGDYVWGGDASGTGSSKTVTFNTAGTRTITVYRAASAGYNQSNTASATLVVDGSPPEAPQNLQISGLTATGFTASWSAPAGEAATSYRVRKRNTEEFTVIGNVLSYPFLGVSAGTSYQVEVQARDDAGNWSGSASYGVTTGGGSGSGGTQSNASVWLDANGDGILDEIVRPGTTNFNYWIDAWYTTVVEYYDYSVNDYWRERDMFHGLDIYSDDFGREYDDSGWAYYITFETQFAMVFDLQLEANQPFTLYRDLTGSDQISPGNWEYILGSATGPAYGDAHVFFWDVPAPFQLVNSKYFFVKNGRPVGGLNFSLPGGATMEVNTSGVFGGLTLSGGVKITTGGGQAAVTGHPNISANGSLTLPDGTVVAVDSSGEASVTFSNGIRVKVNSVGKVGLSVPPGLTGITARVLDTVGKILDVAQNGVIFSVKDVLGQVLNLPSGGILDELPDIGVNGMTGALLIGTRLGTQADNQTVWIPIEVQSPQLLVDANCDGTITHDSGDSTSTQSPYRFWLNDDDDTTDTNGNDIPAPSNSSNGAAATNFEGDGVVDGARDLVDFFPVFLDIKQLLTVLPHTAPGVKYKLKQADGALNFVYTKLNRADALKYQSEDKGAIFGPALNQPAASAGTRRISATGVELSAQFLTGVKDQDWGVILVEGWLPTTNPLVLSVEKDGAVIAEVKLELSIGSVEDMYRRINLRDGADAPAGLAGDLSVRDSDLGKPTSLGEPTNFPDSLTNGKWFVFVVGSNVGGQKMRGWQSEVFKRMYWSQSKARFVGVSWYGDPYSDGNDLVYDYHSAARNAFTTAPVLTAKLNGLSGSKTIAGHSAAALIISSAVADHGLSVSNACLIDAAMSRESFDGSSADDLTGMVPAVWRDYPSSLWASRWSETFNSATDARSTLSWRKRFTGAAGVVHNFYSSTEDVLARYDGTVNGSVIENLRAPGSFAWVIQEKAKGDKLNILSVVHAGSDYGGWGFNLHDPIPITGNLPTWYVPNNNAQRVPKTPAQIGSVTAQMLSDIKIQPLFKTGWGRYYYGNPSVELVDTDPAKYTGPSWIFDLYGVTTGNAIAADPVKRSQILNEAIPALSLAVGSNYTDRFGDARNYDLPSQYADAARWPSARGATVSGVPKWHHSDMREVAYLYLARFYDKLSSLANQ